MQIGKTERLRGGASRDDFSLVEVDLKAESPKADAGADPAHNPSSRKKKHKSMPPGWAVSTACRASVMTGWMASAKRTAPRKSPLLNASCAGFYLRSDTARTSEKGALVTVTTVDPRRDRRKVSANLLQDSGPVLRVERVGDVQREGNLVRVGAVDGSFAPVWHLDVQLERFESSACAVRDEVNRDLARQATDGLTNGDRP